MQSWEVIHSFHALTGSGHNALRERLHRVVDYVIFNQGVGAYGETISASYL